MAVHGRSQVVHDRLADRFESSVWMTPIAPVTIGIATMIPTYTPRSQSRRSPTPASVTKKVSKTRWTRNAGTTPSAEEKRIIATTTMSRPL